MTPKHGVLYNKSIYRSDEQKNLYKALVDAHKCDKLILDTYGDTVTLKRRRDDEDKDEEPFAGSIQGSKRRRGGKELESTNAPKENTSKTSGKSTEGSKSQHKIASEGIALYLTIINNDLEYLRGSASSKKYTTLVTKTKAIDYGQIKWIADQKHRHPTACGISSIRIQKLPKKLNLTKPDTYRSDLKCKEAYTAYSNPRGFIYQNKDKQNKLMRIDELHKFYDGTLNDVRTALDDHLKGIWMQYLPQII
nr:hypothetical protein [Tanacetum cinerariifolium]